MNDHYPFQRRLLLHLLMFFFVLLSLLYSSCDGELFYSQLKQQVEAFEAGGGDGEVEILSAIRVLYSGTPIVSGSYTHDFGSAYADSITFTGTRMVSFTIENTGTEQIDISSIDMSGTDSSHYALDDSSTTLILTPGSSTSFSIRFTPTSSGTKSDTAITVNSNDPVTGAYTFDLTGSALVDNTVTTGDVYANCAGVYYNSGTGNIDFSFSLSEQVVFNAGGVSPQASITTLNHSNIFVEENINSGGYQEIDPENVTLSTVGSSKNLGVFFLLDASGSAVSGGQWDGIKNYLQTYFVGNMNSSDRGAVAGYSDVTLPRYHPYPASFSPPSTLSAEMSALTPATGNSTLFTPLFYSIDEIDSSLTSDFFRAVLIFCDGYDMVNGGFTLNDCVTQSTSTNIPIYYIAWTPNSTNFTDGNLYDLSTSGFYTYDSSSSFNPTLMQSNIQDVLSHMNATYLIRWDTAGTPGDSVTVRVTVQYGDTSDTYTTQVMTESFSL